MGIEVFKKLLKVQMELKVPKGQYNDFGKYKYRSCEDILEALKPICAVNELFLYLGDEIEFIGGRYYVRATATVVDIGTGETFSTSASAREEDTKKGMDGSQITGAASSYARKYALNALFGIDDTKDSDTTNTHGKEAPGQEAPPTKITVAQLLSVAKLKGVTEPQLIKKYKIESGKDVADVKFIPQDYKLKYYQQLSQKTTLEVPDDSDK